MTPVQFNELFFNNDKANDGTKTVTLRKTLCKVLWHHEDVSTSPHGYTEESLLYKTIILVI